MKDRKIKLRVWDNHGQYWVDTWMNSSSGADCQDSFETLEEATASLWQFDGSGPTEEIVFEN